jgi:hypothetical protein
MLFGHNGLPSGPQKRFSAEEKETKVKGGKRKEWIDEEGRICFNRGQNPFP